MRITMKGDTMEDLIAKLYDKIVYWEDDSTRLNLEYDQTVCAILEPLKGSKTEDEISEISEIIYTATYQARKDGFKLGVRCMASLLTDALRGS